MPTACGVRGRMMRQLQSLLGSAINPANWGNLYQWLYDGATTPIEQTSAITGSPMTVVNSRAGTGDRRELRQGHCNSVVCPGRHYTHDEIGVISAWVTANAANAALLSDVEFAAIAAGNQVFP